MLIATGVMFGGARQVSKNVCISSNAGVVVARQAK